VSLRINQNVMAANAHRNLASTSGRLGKSLEKLSSGFRINRAGDDAAGLVISETLRAQIGGLKQATRNSQDAISVVQTAEGALGEVHSMLQRIRDLAVQAGNTGANGGPSGDSVAAIQQEVAELVDAIQTISDTTAFNGTALLDGSATSLTFQVGANADETLTVALTDMGTDALGASTTASIASLASANALTSASTADVLAIVDAAIADVSTFRGTLGAAQNRLEHQITNLQVTQENLTASESRIRDVDMAAEMAEFTRNQILSQAGTAMLAQANQAPQQVLSLLQG
jgi:flagellin